jgi:hypothetical protein
MLGVDRYLALLMTMYVLNRGNEPEGVGLLARAVARLPNHTHRN